MEHSYQEVLAYGGQLAMDEELPRCPEVEGALRDSADRSRPAFAGAICDIPSGSVELPSDMEAEKP